jgi:hypothetical protein
LFAFNFQAQVAPLLVLDDPLHPVKLVDLAIELFDLPLESFVI